MSGYEHTHTQTHTGPHVIMYSFQQSTTSTHCKDRRQTERNTILTCRFEGINWTFTSVCGDALLSTFKGRLCKV